MAAVLAVKQFIAQRIGDDIVVAALLRIAPDQRR
jgi:hypothetical protein